MSTESIKSHSDNIIFSSPEGEGFPPSPKETLKGVLIHMWERGWLFLKKAGTIILGVSILLWVATTFPGLPDNAKEHFANQRNMVHISNLAEKEKAIQLSTIDNKEAEAALEHSVAGCIGYALEPLFTPLGFDWKLVTPVIGAIAAKEIFVAQLGIVYSVGEADEGSESLRSKIQVRYTPLVGFCIMLFMLVVAPCLATFAITKSESGSCKWAFLQFGGLTVLAWILTAIVYQAGSILGIGIG